MKSIFLLMALATGVVSAGFTAGPGAEVVIEPAEVGTPHEAYFAVDFDGLTGYAVGTSGKVVQTNDWGENWHPVEQSLTSMALMDVNVEGDRVMVAGQMGIVLVRAEEGNWQKVQTGTPMRLLALDQNGKGQAVAVGQFGTILVSRDAGMTWKSGAPNWADYHELGQEPQLYDVVLADDGTITVVGEFGYVLRSSDLGKNWTLLHKGDESLNALALGPEGLAIAVGQNGLILRSTDSGTSWTAVPSPTNDILLGAEFIDHANGVLVSGIRTMLVSRDQGRTWSRISAGDIETTWYQDVSETGPDSPPVAVGHAGRIIRIVGADLTAQAD